MILGKYYDLVFSAPYKKIAHLADLFNGEQLAKDGKYMFESGDGFLQITNDLYFDKPLKDFINFLQYCKEYHDSRKIL